MKRGNTEVKKILAVFLPIIIAFQFSMTASAHGTDTWLSDDVQGYCEEIGEEYCICPEMLMAIIEAESRGDAYAENGGCKGLCQVSVKWNKSRMRSLGVTDIFDEYGNILVGADYLAELFEEYEDAALVLDVYHGDSKAVKRAERGEISVYAQKILDRSAELERLHGK